MSKTNYLLCSGEACPLRMSCKRHQEWLNNEDFEAPEMDPDYEGECPFFQERTFDGADSQKSVITSSFSHTRPIRREETR